MRVYWYRIVMDAAFFALGAGWCYALMRYRRAKSAQIDGEVRSEQSRSGLVERTTQKRPHPGGDPGEGA